MDQTLFNEALMFALKAHDGVTRKGTTTPFILHPMEVATIAASMTENNDVIVAALLHDTVEDAGVTLEEIADRFGVKVAMLVQSETENKRRDILPEDSWYIRKEESLEVLRTARDLEIKILWLSDKLSNVRSFFRMHAIKGDSMWQDFHQRDPKMQMWYYRKVAEYTAELADKAAYIEYCYLIDRIFEEVPIGTD